VAWRKSKSKGSEPSNASGPAPAGTGSRWLAAEENRWGVPVADVSPFTLGIVSTSSDPQSATNAVSFTNDDGLGFVGLAPLTPRRTPLALGYRVDRVLADGPVFIPRQMEHKWAVFHHDRSLLFVRSWTRRVHLVVPTVVEQGQVRLTEAVGAVVGDDEEHAFTEAAIDFILRSHVLGEIVPAPLPSGIGDDLTTLPGAAFSLYGDKARLATTHRIPVEPSSGILRSHPLLHIAVARNDLAAAQHQLDRGVPIDLVAQDGLTALQWALPAPGVEALAWLVARGLPVDARSLEGATALMNAVQSGDEEKIGWLLDAGADPNASDDRGFTALHRAAELGRTAAARLLLERGADRGVAAFGHTALSLAHDRGHAELEGLLQA